MSLKCKHCEATVVKSPSGNQWVTPGGILPQYCWVDEVNGGQLHEVDGMEKIKHDEQRRGKILLLQEQIRALQKDLQILLDEEAGMHGSATLEEVKAECLRLIGLGDQIKAVKYYRQHTSLSLMESKAACRNIAVQAGIHVGW